MTEENKDLIIQAKPGEQQVVVPDPNSPRPGLTPLANVDASSPVPDPTQVQVHPPDPTITSTKPVVQQETKDDVVKRILHPRAPEQRVPGMSAAEAAGLEPPTSR